MESVLRVTSLALAAGKDSEVMAFLKTAADVRQRRASSPDDSAEYVAEDIASSYKYLLAFNESKRLTAEAEVLSAVLSDVASLAPTASKSPPKKRIKAVP